jgi:hypothetical protein
MEEVIVAATTQRDLASVELWQRSLERSRRRRALAENPRRGSRSKVVAGALSIGALAILAAPASGISSEQACEDAGGTYVKTGGTADCQFPVGNSDNVKTTSQKGSFNSSHEEGLTNPGGTNPPGQQGGDTLP